MEVVEDTGLGLNEFLSGGRQEKKAEEIDQSSSRPSEETPEKKKAADGSDGPSDRSDKSSETPKLDTKKDKVIPKGSETSPETSPEGKKEPGKEVQKAKEPEKPDEGKEKEGERSAGVDWNSEENPYRQRHADTVRWANEVNKQNLSLQKKLEIIEKKLDGTYDPEKDGKAEQPSAPNEEALPVAEQIGRAAASITAARQIYGKEQVDKDLQQFEKLFSRNRIISERVLGADLPAVEAIKVLKEYRFMQKYGDDPDKMLENIRKEAETELVPKLTEKITKEIMARIDKKENLAKGIGELRDAGGPSNGEKSVARSKSLDQIFDG